MNQIKRWFALITRRQIQRGSFVSAKDLMAKIEAFVAAYNVKATPFQWAATSDANFAKLDRPCEAFNGTTH